MARDIKSDLVAFLRTHFDESEIPVTFEAGDPADPTTVEGVRFAAYDGANDYPQVAIVSEDPVVPGGGQTQMTGIDAGGKGGIQDVVTSVQIDCWGGPHDADIYQSEGAHPDVVANALARETHASSSGPTSRTRARRSRTATSGSTRSHRSRTTTRSARRRTTGDT
jgi:hypothetical protein